MANGAASRMTWTPGGAPTSSTTWTISVWVKKVSIGEEAWIATEDSGGEVTWNNGTRIYFNSSDQLRWYEDVAGTVDADLVTNRVFRDPAAWYHLVFKWDTTNGTPGDRMKIFVNGVEETSFATDNNPDSSRASGWGTAYYSAIGQKVATGSASGGYSGAMTHFHYADGTAYDASTFGSTDATSGIWVINTSPTVTYGTNGFFIMKDAWSGTDESPNSNNWTPLGSSGTTTLDNPSNNFCTWTPLLNRETSSSTFSQGGTTVKNTNANWGSLGGTSCVKSGKWYYEVIGGNTTGYMHYGFCSTEFFAQGGTSYAAQGEPGTGINFPSYTYYGYNGNIYYNTTTSNGTTASYGDTYANTDYIGVFLDLDNSKMYWSKNGTIQNSGTGITIDNANSDFWTPITGTYSDATGHETNFGNGVFGTTTLGGTTYEDANGEGTFKYSPNDSGGSSFDGSAKDFYAVCTNNIKLYGG